MYTSGAPVRVDRTPRENDDIIIQSTRVCGGREFKFLPLEFTFLFLIKRFMQF